MASSEAPPRQRVHSGTLEFVRARVHDEEALLGQIAHGVSDTLSTDPRKFRAAVGHVVDAERIHVVHDQGANLETFMRAVDDAHVICEEPRL